MGCITGTALATAGVSLWINEYNEDRREKGKSEMSDEAEALLVSCAGAIGCLLGSELAGRTEEYVAIKREEYRAEAAQLAADIEHIEESMEDVDGQLAWMNSQANELKTQAAKVKTLSAGREYMAGELKKATTKRKEDIKLIESNLKAARDDARFLSKVSEDAEQKKKLQQQVRELDKRIAETRKVKEKILAADVAVSYV